MQQGEAAAPSDGKQIGGFLDRCIGTVIGRFEPAIGSMSDNGLIMEATVGEGPHRRL